MSHYVTEVSSPVEVIHIKADFPGVEGSLRKPYAAVTVRSRLALEEMLVRMKDSGATRIVYNISGVTVTLKLVED